MKVGDLVTLIDAADENTPGGQRREDKSRPIGILISKGARWSEVIWNFTNGRKGRNFNKDLLVLISGQRSDCEKA